jgi:hypothetical protein
MRLMRAFFVGFLVAVALATAGGAGAKGAPPFAVGICGPHGCATVVAVSNWNEPAWLSGEGVRVAPAAPAAFYTVGLLYSDRTTSPIAYYVPSARLIKLKGSIPGRGEAIWLDVAPEVAALFDRASTGLKPFGRPQVGWAMVGTRRIKRPSSYARLYLLDGPVVPDPVGSPPSLQYQTSDREAWFAAWAPYLERVDDHWIRVQIGTRVASPWDIRESFVWVGRRSDILKRDGVVIQIPAFVAQLIRRGAPL